MSHRLQGLHTGAVGISLGHIGSTGELVEAKPPTSNDPGSRAYDRDRARDTAGAYQQVLAERRADEAVARASRRPKFLRATPGAPSGPNGEAVGDKPIGEGQVTDGSFGNRAVDRLTRGE